MAHIWIDRIVYNRDRSNDGVVTGTVRCRQAGCPAPALSVKWINGKRTYPCSECFTELSDGVLQLL